MKILLWLGSLCMVCFFGLVAWKVTDSFLTPSSNPPASTSSGSEETKKSDDNIPTSRKVLGVMIVIIVIGVFFSGAYAQWEPSKKLYQQKFWRGPVSIAVYILTGVYLVIAFLLPKLWGLIWGDQIFFWSLTIGVIILTGLRTMTGSDGKPLSYAQKGSLVFAIFLVFGLLAQILANPHWRNGTGSTSKESIFSWAFTGTHSNLSHNTASEEIILREIAKCESGGKQFTDDVVTRNMNETPADQSDDDIGEWQINLKHQAAIIKELEANIFEREDNYRVAKEILRRQGTGPWNKSRACWASKLTALGISPDGKGSIDQAKLPIELGTVEVPQNDWSKEVPTPNIPGTLVSWGRLDTSVGGDCQIMFDRDPKKVFPIAGNFTRFSHKVVQFYCPEPSAQVKVELIPQVIPKI